MIFTLDFQISNFSSHRSLFHLILIRLLLTLISLRWRWLRCDTSEEALWRNSSPLTTDSSENVKVLPPDANPETGSISHIYEPSPPSYVNWIYVQSNSLHRLEECTAVECTFSKPFANMFVERIFIKLRNVIGTVSWSISMEAMSRNKNFHFVLFPSICINLNHLHPSHSLIQVLPGCCALRA